MLSRFARIYNQGIAVGQMVAFGATFQYRPRACYAGIAETSVYVDRASRGQVPDAWLSKR
jgi:L-amino acid N-acyltransferase YncA